MDFEKEFHITVIDVLSLFKRAVKFRLDWTHTISVVYKQIT